MDKENWYRNTQWTQKIKDEFFQHLNRSKTDYNKAQYIHIQASTLFDSKKENHVIVALELLDLMLQKYPHPSHLATAYLQRALCYEFLKDSNSALEAYRDSVKAEREKDSIKVIAPLHFGWFVITHKKTGLYDEVLRNMKLIIEPYLILPMNQFKFASIYAIIIEQKEEHEKAKEFASQALEIAHKNNLFKKNKLFSFIKSSERLIIKKLKKILTISTQ